MYSKESETHFDLEKSVCPLWDHLQLLSQQDSALFTLLIQQPQQCSAFSTPLSQSSPSKGSSLTSSKDTSASSWSTEFAEKLEKLQCQVRKEKVEDIPQKVKNRIRNNVWRDFQWVFEDYCKKRKLDQYLEIKQHLAIMESKAHSTKDNFKKTIEIIQNAAGSNETQAMLRAMLRYFDNYEQMYSQIPSCKKRRIRGTQENRKLNHKARLLRLQDWILELKS